MGLSKKCGAVYAMHADIDDDISYVSLSFLPQLMSAFTFNSFNTCHGELFCRRVSFFFHGFLIVKRVYVLYLVL